MKIVTQAATLTALVLFGVASAAYAQSGGSSGGGSGGGSAGGASGGAAGGANGTTGMGVGSATSGSGATASPGTAGTGSSTSNSPSSMPGTSGAVGDDKIDRTNRGTSGSSITTPRPGEPTGANNPSVGTAPGNGSATMQR